MVWSSMCSSSSPYLMRAVGEGCLKMNALIPCWDERMIRGATQLKLIRKIPRETQGR